MSIFQTERLIIRPFTDRDSDHFYSLQGNVEVMKYIRPPRTREESDQFLFDFVLKPRIRPFQGYWALEDRDSSTFMGSFVIMPMPSNESQTQLGYSLLPQYWGRGYATEATHGGVKYFKEQAQFEELFAVTEVPNTASQRVLLKAGFKLKAKTVENDIELFLYHLHHTK